uniref:Uncharacterized protein n=1 Tax=Ananas comosus var. bracteatus TaxID=296719 RepID=A0A6V7NYI2_ANACO|nr:unnamed protein product [Ananas comosus var. bracteatus]
MPALPGHASSSSSRPFFFFFFFFAASSIQTLLTLTHFPNDPLHSILYPVPPRLPGSFSSTNSDRSSKFVPKVADSKDTSSETSSVSTALSTQSKDTSSETSSVSTALSTQVTSPALPVLQEPGGRRRAGVGASGSGRERRGGERRRLGKGAGAGGRGCGRGRKPVQIESGILSGTAGPSVIGTKGGGRGRVRGRGRGRGREWPFASFYAIPGTDNSPKEVHV